MKIRRHWMYTGIAILCVVLGLKLPDLVFVYLDASSSGAAWTFNTDAVSVGVELNITDYLRLAGSTYETYNVDEDAAESDSAEIFDSALEALALLAEYERKAGVPETCTVLFDIFVNRYDKGSGRYTRANMDHSEKPVMAAAQLEISPADTSGRNSSGNTQATVQGTKKITMTAVLWECLITDGEGNYIKMIMDDTSKKLLSFYVYWADELSSRIMDVDMDMDRTLRSLTDAFSLFCLEYYGLEQTKVNISIPHGVPKETSDAGENYDSETYAFLDEPAFAETVAVDYNAPDGDGERTLESVPAQEDPRMAVRVVDDGSYAYLQYTESSGNVLKLSVSLNSDHYSFNSATGATTRIYSRN